jgi:hypothetical protein
MLVAAGKNVVPVIKMRADVRYARDMRKAEAMAFAINPGIDRQNDCPAAPFTGPVAVIKYSDGISHHGNSAGDTSSTRCSVSHVRQRTVGKHGRLEYPLSYDPGGAGWSTG